MGLLFGPYLTMKTFSLSLGSLRCTTTLCQQWRSGWSVGAYLCRIPASIPPPWCVNGPTPIYIFPTRGLQLLGLARALLYLHTHPSGPIVHGDVRGVGPCLSALFQSQLTPTIGKRAHRQRWSCTAYQFSLRLVSWFSSRFPLGCRLPKMDVTRRY